MSKRKLALFVEGQTEQIFLESLIREIAGAKNIYFDRRVVSANSLITLRQTNVIPQDPDAQYFVLLVNCQNDERVKSVVLDQRDSLARAQYTLILGLRDLYPQLLQNLAKIEATLSYRVPTKGLPTHILLAVAETEAWFLQEHTHFSRIDPRLDVATFKAIFGFDPLTESAETLPAPAAMLHQIYSSVGKAYHKDRKRVERTVDALDYAQVYVSLPDKLPHMKKLIAHIDNFLGSSTNTAPALVI